MFFSANVWAARCGVGLGWVVLSEKVRVVIIDYTLRDVYQYYVYNPFTGDIISLPRLDMPTHGGDLGCFATFTSDSTSSDCVFIYHRVDIGSLAHAQLEMNHERLINLLLFMLWPTWRGREVFTALALCWCCHPSISQPGVDVSD